MASLQVDAPQVEDVTNETTEKPITKEQAVVAPPSFESEKNVVDLDDDEKEVEEVAVPPEEKAESSDFDGEEKDVMEPSFYHKEPAGFNELDDDDDDDED